MHDEDDYYFFHAKIACQDRAQGFQEIPSHIIIFESKKSKTKRQTFFLNIFSSTSTVVEVFFPAPKTLRRRLNPTGQISCEE